ncbi:uncharacterized protein Dana_GF11833 [Drosophila ananassae]|uniref:Uncharacterized protein n=1 Tax=Drosophila ananassae TaxID=7217 RepID=B3MFH7_DROAN|nr:uncharacterized protein LOC6494695 [Drosophila ananassae]EDV36662.2 uncharacterized protein Dana_GF11833 [Drosophila ananassae]
MNQLIRSIINHFRGPTIRRYLVIFPDYDGIRKPLVLEDLRSERGIMDKRSRELHTEQKRIEYMLTDLTRCIRGLEFDLKVNSERQKKQRKDETCEEDQQKPGSGPVNAAPASDKKSPKVSDFSD